MAGWMNGDGLYVKFGGDEADLIKGGHRIDGANKHTLELTVEGSTFTATLEENSSTQALKERLA